MLKSRVQIFLELKYKSADRQLRQGFTLVELMIVLAILGIVLGIGGAGLLSYKQEAQLKSAARELALNMQEARAEAIKRNMSYRVVFDVINSRYAISVDNGPDDTWSTIGDNNNTLIVSLSDYGKGIDYGKGSADFDATTDQNSIPSDFVSYNHNVATYNPRGTCSCGYVYLSNQNNDAYAVGTIVTGVISMKRWTGSDWSE